MIHHFIGLLCTGLLPGGLKYCSTFSLDGAISGPPVFRNILLRIHRVLPLARQCNYHMIYQIGPFKHIISSLREERTKRKSLNSCQKHALNVETTLRGLSNTNNPGEDIEPLCKLDCPNHADNGHGKTLDLGGNQDVNPRSYSKTEFVSNHILSQVVAYSNSFGNKNLNSYHSVDPSGSKPMSCQVARDAEAHNRSSRHDKKRRYSDIQFSRHKKYMSKRRRSDENESDYDFRIEYSSEIPDLRERLQILHRQYANNSKSRRQFSNIMYSKPVSTVA